MSDLRNMIRITPGFELLGYLRATKKWYVSAKSPWDLYSTTAEGKTPEEALKILRRRLRLIKAIKLKEIKEYETKKSTRNKK